ncbi:hypothetical protein NL526_30395, partial [Klebsiella pneumoniae]|nr:hypothetical protein [Klebsiella pneumoniae]
KSALVVFLADFFSSVFGQRVLVVDLDAQQSATVALLGEEALLEVIEKKASVAHLLLTLLDRTQPANGRAFLSERPAV